MCQALYSYCGYKRTTRTYADVGDSYVKKSPLHRVKSKTQALWEFRRVTEQRAQGVQTRGGGQNARREILESTEGQPGTREIEHSKKGTQYEQSQDTVQNKEQSWKVRQGRARPHQQESL